MKNFFPHVLCFCFLLFAASPVMAAEGGAVVSKQVSPSRASLISFWEEKTLDDENVKQFEKTGEKGVYKFETTFFPYKGRLKLLNAVVTKTSDTSYPGFYTGIVEVELADAPEDFFSKYAASYSAWTAQNYFYFDSKQGVWFPSTDWSAHMSGAASVTTATSSSCPIARYRDILWFGFIAVILAALVILVKKQNQKVWKNHAIALEEQQRGLRIAEESLQHQKEHTKMLKEILAALKKK